MLVQQIGPLQVRLLQGDITKSTADTIVNAANPRMIPGGGVDGAINRAAGPQLGPLQKSLGPIETGTAVLTNGFNLPAKFVIHTAGPIWHGGQHHEEVLLANCYQNCLALAEAHHLTSIAFPAISTGVYHFPIQKAATIVHEVLNTFAPLASSVKQVDLINFDERTVLIYEDVFKQNDD